MPSEIPEKGIGIAVRSQIQNSAIVGVTNAATAGGDHQKHTTLYAPLLRHFVIHHWSLSIAYLLSNAYQDVSVDRLISCLQFRQREGHGVEKLEVEQCKLFGEVDANALRDSVEGLTVEWVWEDLSSEDDDSDDDSDS
ncbi:hypothetical protein HGRIS_000383 [Hohenbuehelia grisea]|uniref:Uncharacterized protein n=1 Tax=Hohenbuehelia grisea TaxID=104357 RepID=A0ABR3JSS2_9AGAR